MILSDQAFCVLWRSQSWTQPQKRQRVNERVGGLILKVIKPFGHTTGGS